MRTALPSVLSLIVCLTMISLARAQQGAGKISGSVQSADNRPVESATVILLRGKDSSIRKMAVSDGSGRFSFENIANGKYLVKVEAVGYDKYMGKPVEITDEHPQVQVNAITISPTDKSLIAVTVSAARPLIENKIDKTVVNVDASPTNTGLTALEVLERSPGITVDNDGNISLKGKQSVIVMLDGKPTYLNATQLANLLKSMSASQLDQIEIMTQPPAKYDATGNSGIINIKTKKNRNNGFNGSITSSAIVAIYFKQTNSVNFNWRQGKFNVFGSYGYSHWEGFNELDIGRNYRNDRQSAFNSYVKQHTFGRFIDYNTNYKAGLDYFASKNTTISAGMNGFIDNSHFNSRSRADFYDSLGVFTKYNTAETNNSDPWRNLGINVGLQQKLNSRGAELDINGDYIRYRSKSPQYSNNYLYNPNGSLVAVNNTNNNPNPYLLNGYLPGNIDIYTLKADYSTPLKDNITLEAGAKTSYVKTDNDARYTLYDTASKSWYVDNNRSNHFIYKENINAVYLSLQKQIKKITIKAGVRAEQTISKGDQVTKSIQFNKDYTKFFPTAYMSYQVDKNNTVQVSYGRRIERPSYPDLNPFQYQLDRYTYQQGNPYLQPQFSHNIELGYNFKGDLNISVNYTTISDIINDVLITRQDEDKNFITYQTKQNIASSRNMGASINYGKQLKKWWNLNVFANVFNNEYTGYIDGEYINVAHWSYSTNFSSRFTFNKGWSSEVSGFLRGKTLFSSAILAEPMGMFALGAGKQVLKNKGSIRLNLRDPFYLMRFNGSTDMNKFYTRIHSVWDNRRIILTLTYRFGKTTGGPQQRRKSAAEDEQNRVNVGGSQQ